MKILITGGTNGMGKGVAKVLAELDNQHHEIIVLGRSQQLGDATIEEIKNATKNPKISLILCDLTKLREVRNAIDEIHKHHTFLDAIFINAGLGYAATRVETEDRMDPHFQVNYLSHFMLLLNLLALLEKSSHGGRVVFNVTRGGEIFWDNIQMTRNWHYEKGVHQAMVAKRMLLSILHKYYQRSKGSKVAFIGFEIPKTVWTNQINLIPRGMKIMASIMKSLGMFISIDDCGKIMAPLFTEPQIDNYKKSGKFLTRKKNRFVEMTEDPKILNSDLQKKLWRISVELCNDKITREIAEKFTQ